MAIFIQPEKPSSLYVCIWVKSYPITGLDRRFGLQYVEAPRISRQSAYEGGKVVSCTFSRLHGHSAPGRFKSMKNSYDPIGNQTRNLPACSAAPQPTAPTLDFKVTIISLPILCEQSKKSQQNREINGEDRPSKMKMSEDKHQ